MPTRRDAPPAFPAFIGAPYGARAMSKKKNSRSKGLPIGGPFTPIRNEEHDSLAYHDLTGNAAKLYGYIVRVARSVAVKAGAYSEHIAHFDYTYSEAKRRGFSESTFKRAIRELWRLGFINVVVIGGRTASKERGRMPSRYQLSTIWNTYGDGSGKWRDRTRIEADPWESPSEPRAKDVPRW